MEKRLIKEGGEVFCFSDDCYNTVFICNYFTTHVHSKMSFITKFCLLILETEHGSTGAQSTELGNKAEYIEKLYYVQT
jgi:hypothetical protein